MDALRQAAINMNYWSIFQADINAGRYYNLEKLYDAAQITNDLLVKQLDRHIAVMTDISKAVFNDIPYSRKM